MDRDNADLLAGASSRRRLVRGAAGGLLAAAAGVLPTEIPPSAEAIFQKDVQLTFIANGAGAFELEVWQRKSWHGEFYELKWDRRVINPNQQETFRGDGDALALVLWVDHQKGIALPAYFRARNDVLGAPYVTIGPGTWGRNGWETAGPQYGHKLLAEGESLTVPGFRVDRGPDLAHHKDFIINAVGARD